MNSVAAQCAQSPLYAKSLQEYGPTCEVNGQVLRHEDIADACVNLLQHVSTTLVGGREERDARRARRIRRREAKQKYAQALSQQYGIEITPGMIGMGIFGLAVAFFGGVPMLLLCIASVVFEHFFAEEVLGE